MSIQSAKKLRTALNWMVYLSNEKQTYVKEIGRTIKFRLSFITLTLPASQIHSDQEIKDRCLVPFLQWLRDSAKVKKYVWKAEIQKNGNIHFHITIDKFIHYKRIRQQWNKNLTTLGYIKRFQAQHNKISPPSTEIKSVKNVKNLGAYLAAYLAPGNNSRNKKTKPEYNIRIISGRLWGVSSYLSKLKSLKITEDFPEFNYLLKYIKGLAVKSFHQDYIHVYYITSDVFNEIVDSYTDRIGFDWLIESNFDINDIGQLCPN